MSFSYKQCEYLSDLNKPSCTQYCDSIQH